VVEHKFVKIGVKHLLEHVWDNLAESFRSKSPQYDMGIVSGKDHGHSDILAYALRRIQPLFFASTEGFVIYDRGVDVDSCHGGSQKCEVMPSVQ